jgi:hypothetical protein
MSDLLASLQSMTGLNADLVKNGFGAILSFLKDQLPADLFAKVESAVPRSGEALSGFQANQKEPGLLGNVGAMIGNLFGGQAGELPKLFEKLSAAGLSLDQAREFLPKALEALKGVLPAELLDKIMQTLPGLGEALKQPAG